MKRNIIISLLTLLLGAVVLVIRGGIIPHMADAKIAANELDAQVSCHMVYAACNSFFERKGHYPLDLQEIASSNPPYITTINTCGYTYRYATTNAGFAFSLSPIEMGRTGRFNFYIDQTDELLKCDAHNACWKVTD